MTDFAHPPRHTAIRPMMGQRRLRIGLIAPPWLPVPAPAYGGTEAAVDVLARGLKAAGHDVVLYTTTESSCPVTLRSSSPSAPRSRMGHTLIELPHVIDAYRALADCDVIHDHTLLGPVHAGTLGRSRPPVCATVHGSFDDAANKIYSALDPSIGLIGISRHQASTSPVHLDAVIHHGIDTRRIEMGRGGGGYVAFLGRMTSEKGVHLAIRAARKAGMPLRIAAKMVEDTEVEYFRTRIEPLLGPGVDYLGELNHDEKFELLRGAVALVNPIQWDEPFGVVMIEALAAGTPVLAFPKGSAPEIVQHGLNGYLCADLDELVAAIGAAGNLVRDRCRSDAEERFSMERLAKDHVAVYRTLVVCEAGK